MEENIASSEFVKTSIHQHPQQVKTHKIWARVGMELEVTEAEIEELKATKGKNFSSLFNDGKVTFNGNTYFPDYLDENIPINGPENGYEFEFDL